MNYLGDYRTGATVRLMWDTNASAGGSITRATDGSIRIYKNVSDTQRSSAAGITDTEDADAVTGIHRLSIDLSDNTDAGFYAAGSDYFVVLVGAAIDGQTVNKVLGSFSIENRNPPVDVTKVAGVTISAYDLAVSSVSGKNIVVTGGPATDDSLNGNVYQVVAGTGIGQCIAVTDYTGSSGTIKAYFAPSIALDSTSRLSLLGFYQKIAANTGMIEGLHMAAAAAGGKLSGVTGSTPTLRDLDDATDMIALTVDANKNRTAVTRTNPY